MKNETLKYVLYAVLLGLAAMFLVWIFKNLKAGWNEQAALNDLHASENSSGSGAGGGAGAGGSW